LRLFTFLAFPVGVSTFAICTFVTKRSSIAERFDAIAGKIARWHRYICTGILTDGVEKTGIHDTFIYVNFTVLALKTNFTGAIIFTNSALGADTAILARNGSTFINIFIAICTAITISTVAMVHTRR
tara:strand:+ start:197 stop:577 length:381 start_codon:yes stop_codon:yes gene_type:complete